MNLRKRLGMLRGVYGEFMPYRDPHTAGPALWALYHQTGEDFEVSVVPVEGSTPWRKGLEALAIALYRQEHGRSPTVEFGRMPAGYRASSSYNRRLLEAGRVFRGSPSDEIDASHTPGIPPLAPLTGDPHDADCGGHPWSPWLSLQAIAARRLQGSGLYRIRGREREALMYIGQGLIAPRLLAQEGRAMFTALVRPAVAVAILLTILGPNVNLIASAQGTPEPQRYGRASQGYASQFAEVLDQLDAFWMGNFEATGGTYRSPAVIPLEDLVITGCGPAGPEDFAFYCRNDETIYYSPAGFAEHERRFGDFAPIVVTAHEWGHHVQRLVGLTPEPGNAFELQADCLSGAYASDAGQQGLLDPGDITEAVISSADAGDSFGLPQDAPGAHGTNDDRVIAFMRGFLDGVTGCSLPLSPVPNLPHPPTGPDDGDPASGPAPTDHRVPDLVLSTLVPSVLELPLGQPFHLESEGISTFDDMVRSFPDPVEAHELLLEWGWQENVYRIYASDNPPPNAVGWVALGIHRFASVDGAAAALPYFAAARRNALGYQPVDVGLFADQTEAMAGQAVNGEELIIYARRGNLVFRVDGIAPNGDPTADVFEAILMPLRQLVDEPRVVSPEFFDVLPDVSTLLPGLSLTEEHARSGGTIAATFPDVAEAERLFQDWGWRESAARVFTGSTPAGTTRVEVSVFRLANDQAAASALPYFLDARAEALDLSATSAPPARADEARAISGSVEGEQEATVYIRRGRDLFRITGIGMGNLMVDIATLIR